MNDNYSYTFGKKVYDLSARTHVMGILNVAPDTFSHGVKYLKSEDAVSHGKSMAKAGADFIEVGGASTRAGADEVSEDVELDRIIPVIEKLSKEINIPLSVNTYRAKVADEALKAGALIVNDISAFGFDSSMAETIAKHKATAVAIHIEGKPNNMQNDPQYNDIVAEVIKYFENVAWKANVAGIKQVIIDPGIGFGKKVEHNLHLIKNLSALKRLDSPIIIGVSRKSVFEKILNNEDAKNRLECTITLNTISILNGAHIIRVHDVEESVRSCKIIDSYRYL